MSQTKRYLYFVQYLGPALPASAAVAVLATGNGNWFWVMTALFYFGTPLIDRAVGSDHRNYALDSEHELRSDRFYTGLLFGLLPLYLATMATIAYTVSTVAMSWHQYLAATISIGAMYAGVFCVGHELGHRTGKRWEMLGARFAVALYGYGHFHVEHNRGHHIHVATPEDAASARMGENVYQFMAREIPHTFGRAVVLERERLAKRGDSFFSFNNQMLQSYAMTVAIYAGITMWLGASIVPFLMACIVAGYFQLTMANYLEHYGLLRAKQANGRYEKCQPHHSWNSNHLFTNVMTLQLQRHSDHHFSASRPYQILRDFDNVPQLPAGYPFMQFLTVIPPLWRRVMDERLVSFVGYDMDRVNVAPAKREQLYARWHKVA